LLKVRSGFQYRIEVYYEAVLVGGLDGLTLDPKEVLEARLYSAGLGASRFLGGRPRVSSCSGITL